VAGLKADQVDALPTAVFASMKPAQFSALNASTAPGFSNEILAGLTPVQEKALKSAFVNALTAGQKAALTS